MDFFLSIQSLKKDFDNLNFEIDELTAIKNDQIEEKEKLTVGNESLNMELQVCRLVYCILEDIFCLCLCHVFKWIPRFKYKCLLLFVFTL